MTTIGMQRPSPVMDEVAGRPVVAHYGDPGAEYAALRSTALLVDRSHRGRMRVSGPKAAEMMTGLVTNDVMSLCPGQGQYAAALTPKGKIVADVRIFATMAGSPALATPAAVDSLLVDVPPRAAAGWFDMVRKYVNPRVAPHHDETDTTRAFAVVGPHARRVVAEVTGVSAATLGGLPHYAHVAAAVDGAMIVVARTPDLELEGYELFLPVAAASLWDRLAGAGAVPGGLAAWEVARVEAGRPEWGIDIDESTIPQEANFDEMHAISYTKGCYVGQETVARVHFRGHVNRHLRGLRFVSHDVPPYKAHLADATGKPLGDVRSATISPRLGPIAIGMVRREVGFGDTVTVRWEGGESMATVVPLPF